MLFDKDGKPAFGDGLGYYSSKDGELINPNDIIIDGQGNLVDTKKNDVLDSNLDPISIQGNPLKS